MEIAPAQTLAAPGIAMQTVRLTRLATQVEAPQPVNHIIVVDCSGSMDSQLPLIRAQLKNKLASLVKEGDTVSIIWFSGRGQCGCLVEKAKVSNAPDLQRLCQAVDQWLKPIALTGFVEPLQEVRRIAMSGGAFSLFFMSDGCDNQWHEPEILRVVAGLRDVLASATFVEYGWCCNRELMLRMTEAAGGVHIFCEDFEAYDPALAANLAGRGGVGKRVAVAVGQPLHGLVFSVTPQGPRVYQVADGKAQVPEDVGAIHWFTPDAAQSAMNDENTLAVKNGLIRFEGDVPRFTEYLNLAKVSDPALLAPVYQGAALLAQRLKGDDATALLAGLGDVKLFRLHANAFGMQNVTDFAAAAVAASNGRMFEEGRREGLRPDPNAFTLLQLLFLLAGDPENLFVPSAMKYKRTSRATEDASEDLTPEERAEIADLTVKAKTASDLEAVQARAAAIAAAKPRKLTFKPVEGGAYSVSNLTWNESRANVSLLVKIAGTVALPADAPAELPNPFPTFIWRNYTIIRDGIANIAELPVRLSQASFLKLREVGVVTGEWERERVYLLDLRALPTINRSMRAAVSARELFTLEYEVLKMKASEKVLKAFKERWCGKRASEGFKVSYSPAANDWLTKQGLTDYSGFNPKRKQAEPMDFYMGLELESAIKGLATIPSYNEFAKKLGKKMTPREAMLKPAYDRCVEFEKANPAEADRQRWIEQAFRDATVQARVLMQRLAQLKFGIVVGRAWPADLVGIEGDGKLTVELDGTSRECSLKLSEVEIKV